MVQIRLKTNNVSCEFSLDFNETKLPDDLIILKGLEKEISNSIYHLKRSNEEIREFDRSGTDQDLFLAYNENKFAINKKEGVLRQIQEKIKSLECLPNSCKITNIMDIGKTENDGITIGHSTDLSCTDLTSTDLTSTDLTSTDLTTTDLTTTDISNGVAENTNIDQTSTHTENDGLYL
ncbi:conserved protein, unknown function [Hepatocystis sp. ex Piliocolobus tephrosceles]|nr:conserved protein, unknown function [Hepatocystis sp. ex Piliocolobus tephrosceles]VWU51981.1 conserved protein, unknown function [Hepatocystis sp. ex Piliocolobus tephrosceles]